MKKTATVAPRIKVAPRQSRDLRIAARDYAGADVEDDAAWRAAFERLAAAARAFAKAGL